MNKKRLMIILGCVVTLLVVGALSSHYLDWPVDSDEASGDIGKATRFSREMESEGLSNMEELLKSDPEFKDGIVAAQFVMQTRAAQFGSLVDMSNEVAGKLPAFAEVLKDMNAAREMVNNVTNSLAESGQNLNAALSGEECPDLAQNTINASLAYTTLQKQNNLANRFIDATDKFLETAQGDDRLKFVRDQWVDYQKMTAALEGDKASAEALAKKGNLLTSEKALAATATFDVVQQVIVMTSTYMQKSNHIESPLSNAITEETIKSAVNEICNASTIIFNSDVAEAAIKSQDVTKFNQVVTEAIQNVTNEVVGSTQKFTNKEPVKTGQHGGPLTISSAIKMAGSTIKVMEAYTSVMSSAQKMQNAQEISSSQPFGLSSQINDVINQIAIGNKATLECRER